MPVNIGSTKALVSAGNFIPVPKPASLNAVSLDLYPKHNPYKVVYSICIPDEPDGKYGPDGRLRMNLKYAEFIDIYA